MPTLHNSYPSYRLHKPSGQAVVTLSGRDIYLGKHGTSESRAEYDRVIGEWLASGRAIAPTPPARAAIAEPQAELTIAELILAYLEHASRDYVKNGQPTSEVANIKAALRPLRRLYGHTTAAAFGPKALKAVRHDLIASGLCRNEVNKRTRHVVRLFAWGVESELVPAMVHHALKTVKALRKGRGEVRESEPVKPVADAIVEAIRPHVVPQVWSMVELQRLTGMRPGEDLIMRTGDIDRTGEVWFYTPATHKTERRDKQRRIYLGPKAQEVLKSWLKADPDAYLFSPREAMETRRAAMRAARKTRVQPSQQNRRKPGARLTLGTCYRRDSYYHAICRGCDAAGVDRFHPNQLRHSAATRLRREFGLDAARAILGHSSPAVTEVYAEIDCDKAAAIMGSVG